MGRQFTKEGNDYHVKGFGSWTWVFTLGEIETGEITNRNHMRWTDQQSAFMWLRDQFGHLNAPDLGPKRYERAGQQYQVHGFKMEDPELVSAHYYFYDNEVVTGECEYDHDLALAPTRQCCAALSWLKRELLIEQARKDEKDFVMVPQEIPRYESAGDVYHVYGFIPGQPHGATIITRLALEEGVDPSLCSPGVTASLEWLKKTLTRENVSRETAGPKALRTMEAMGIERDLMPYHRVVGTDGDAFVRKPDHPFQVGEKVCVDDEGRAIPYTPGAVVFGFATKIDGDIVTIARYGATHGFVRQNLLAAKPVPDFGDLGPAITADDVFPVVKPDRCKYADGIPIEGAPGWSAFRIPDNIEDEMSDEAIDRLWASQREKYNAAIKAHAVLQPWPFCNVNRKNVGIDTANASWRCEDCAAA
jgi:hypothetical protein